MKSLGKVQEIDLSAQFDTNIDFLAPSVFELGEIPIFTPRRSFKREVPPQNDVIMEKITYLESVAKIPSYADPSIFDFKNDEKTKHPKLTL